jgi:hypothetical protein
MLVSEVLFDACYMGSRRCARRAALLTLCASLPATWLDEWRYACK